jgi:glutathione S-transferase
MIKVHGRRSSINVQKVLWTLGELGRPFERETIGGGFGGNDTPAFRAMNPNGLIPVLQDGDITMFESNAIVRYLAARYGEGRLRPRAPRELALAEQWMEWQQTTLGPLVSTIFMNRVRSPPEKADRTALAAAEGKLIGVLGIADARLAQSPWFAGADFTMGDIVAGCLVWRLMQVEMEKPEVPHIRRWFEALQERPAYRQWVMVPVGRNPQEWTAHERALG